MSYLVLARKYRPRTFAELVGQEVSTGVLRGAIAEGRIGHAYLFCGPRGTGKTTTARIFAKALNCEKGPTPDPCGVCERCTAADNGSEIDIVEIDAASNRGINEIRELRDSVGYRPLRARFKVFIVDEVHMLTEHAVNAFLKTLEEPPAHVKFCFATTEPEKLLPTFLSRCQVIRLALIPEAQIAARLTHVLAQEGVRAGPGVVQEIARRSRGGLRDALSLAEQLIALVGADPTLEDLERLGGEGGAEAVEDLLDRVEAGDRAGVVRALAASVSEGDLIGRLLDHVRGGLLAHLCGVDAPFIEGEPALRARMAARAGRLGLERSQVWLEELLHARERIELARGAHGRLVLEATLLDLCRPEASLSLAEIAERLLALERRLEHASAAPPNDVIRPQPPPERRPGPTTAAPTRASATPAPAAASASAPAPEPRRNSIETWNRFLDALQTSAASLADVLRARGRLGEIGAGRARIKLAGVHEKDRAILSGPRAAKTCSAVLSRLLGETIEVVLEEPSAPARAPKDVFTGQVSELFGGRIEDDG